jgi:4-amino-4-deoxy-L-arabinose transferase-like glycosyltransferase
MKKFVLTHKFLCGLIFIFILSFGLRVCVSILYVQNFDRNEIVSSLSHDKMVVQHAIIKTESYGYYLWANQIIQEVKSGKSFFSVGPSNHIGFLYPRILALYGLISGSFIIENDGVIPSGQLIGFFIFQSFLFCLSLIIFFIAISKIFSFPIAFISALFLALEPSLLQYSAMLMTDSLFVAFMLLVISVFILLSQVTVKNEPTKFIFLSLITGILLGVLFLQRSVGILLPLVFFVAILAQNQWKVSKPLMVSILITITAYGFVLSLVGMHNKVRAGFFYVVPTQGAYGLHGYLANKVLASINSKSPEEELEQLTRQALIELNKERIVKNEIRNLKDLNEYELYMIANIFQRQAIQIFKDHPIETFWIAFKNTVKSLNIDPFYTFRLYSNFYKPRSPEILSRQEAQHKSQIPIRVIYSMLIIFPSILGWLIWRHTIEKPLNIFLLLLILYFPIMGGWVGFARYNLPCLVPCSIYWAIFIWELKKKIYAG